MWTELTVLGLVFGAVGVIGATARPRSRARAELDPDTLVRLAMLGPEGRAVEAEFRRSGIERPPRHR